MFITQIIKSETSGEKFLYTFFFERMELLWKFREEVDAEGNGKTVITELVEKIDCLGDDRISGDAVNGFLYIKLSERDYHELITNMGISFYGEFQNHTTLKYKEIKFDDGVFADETVTLPLYTP